MALSKKFGVCMKKRWWVLGSIGLTGLSLLSLYYIITTLRPDSDNILARPQLLFFAFIFLGVGSSTVPVTAFLNQRFAKPGWLERDRTRLLRQGVWVGAFLVLLAYLQASNTLTLMVALVLAGVFILIETFLLIRA